jgi:tetratricopeptide (TPR) repeat protein
LYDNLGNKKEALNFYEKAFRYKSKKFEAFFTTCISLKKIFLIQKTISLIKSYITANNHNYFDVAAGYYLLSENDYLNNNTKKELFHLEKANHFSFLSNEKINKQALNYWLNIIPKKYEQI